tara:strand:- start:638 stop:1483 length:846 start_codon:yes stop_codon:yes gene_type:complete
MNNTDITAVITSFKSEKKILNCIQSLDKSTKIIVIENSNDKKLKERLEKEHTNLKCVLSDRNLGYAKGNNLGLSMVNTKYALIINPDAELHNQAINNFFLSAKSNPNFAIIGPFIQDSKINNQSASQKKGIIEVNSVKGFAMFLNLDQFKDIGFFDENFFIYFEEIDLCKRLINNKKKIYLDTNIIITHAGGTSHEESINYEMEKSRNWHWMWSTFYFHKKHYGYIIALIKIFPKFLSSMIKMIFYGIISNNEKKDIYYCRFEGILNSILMRKSWYRPKIN